MTDNVLLWVLGAGGLVLYTAVAGWIWQARHRANSQRGDEAHFRASLAGLILFTLMTGAAGFGAVLVGGHVLMQQAQSARWASTGGRVTRSEVEPYHLPGRMPGVTRWQPMVAYTYTADGHSYAGDRIAFHAPTGATTAEAAREQIAAFAEGSEITVYYDPQMPESAVLDRRAGSDAVLITGGGVFLLAFHLLGLVVGPHIHYPPFVSPFVRRA